MRRFGGDRVKSAMNFMGLEDDQPLENTMVSKALGNAQTKVEAYHFEIRKHLVEYDDVINTHREVIYEERRKVLDGADLKSNIQEMIEKELGDLVNNYVVGSHPEDWALGDMVGEIRTIFPLPPALESDHLQLLDPDAIHDEIQSYAESLYSQREEAVGSTQLRTIERLVTLRTIDSHWVVHLTSMENLRQGVGLHAYGQRDPLVMYRSEGHEKFQEMLRLIQHDIVHTIFHATMMEEEARRSRAPRRAASKASGVILNPMASAAPSRQPVSTFGGSAKIGRNDMCPCGSGKKYKRCHGVAA